MPESENNCLYHAHTHETYAGGESYQFSSGKSVLKLLVGAAGGLGLFLGIAKAIGGIRTSLDRKGSRVRSRNEGVLRKRIVAPALAVGWSEVNERVADDQPLSFTFSMRPRNIDIAELIIRNVSNPRSPQYGRYLSRGQVHALTSPDPSHIRTVTQWLRESGMSHFLDAASATAQVNVTAGIASRVLRTHFRWIANKKTKQRIVNAGDFWLPAAINRCIFAIYGLHDLPSSYLLRRPMQHAAGSLPNVTPAVIRRIYKVAGVTPSGSVQNRQAVVSIVCGETLFPSDTATFFKHFVPDAPSGSDTVYKYVGTDTKIGGGGTGMGESALDIEYAMGVAPGILTEFWYFCDPYLPSPVSICTAMKNWTSRVLADPDPPQVFSLSMGFQQPFVVGTVPGAPSYGCHSEQVHDINNDLAKIALRGITVVAASGDSGSDWFSDAGLCASDSWLSDTAWEGSVVEKSIPVGDDPLSCCYMAGDVKSWSYVPGIAAPDGTLSNAVCVIYQAGDVHASRSPGRTSGGPYATSGNFFTTWPASSPWVTAVGATAFAGPHATPLEVAAFEFGSGGGFSKMFKADQYQAAAVQHYLKDASVLPPGSLFPADGRGTPDVAAIGQGICVVKDGLAKETQGTSAAAPIFAGLVSLLNEARLQVGKPPMGFLNPWLYENADAFTDIVIGDSARNGVHGLQQRYFFKCAQGWDPVTGLGTPRFDRMLSAALESGTHNTNSLDGLHMLLAEKPEGVSL